jgi:hypothetical protein
VTNLGGVMVDEVAVDEMEQTPIHALDTANVSHARGSRKISERRVAEKLRTVRRQLGRSLARTDR